MYFENARLRCATSLFLERMHRTFLHHDSHFFLKLFRIRQLLFCFSPTTILAKLSGLHLPKPFRSVFSRFFCFLDWRGAKAVHGSKADLQSHFCLIPNDSGIVCSFQGANRIGRLVAYTHCLFRGAVPSNILTLEDIGC
jgi:hypothetical protein